MNQDHYPKTELLSSDASGYENVPESQEAEGELRLASVQILEHDMRLDHALVRWVPEFSRSYLQQLIAQGHVRIDGQIVTTASRRLKLAQGVQVHLVPTEQSRAFRAQAIPLDIVFEDEHVLVINKPVGLVVHPAAGHWSGTLLNALLAHHAGAASLPRAGIVHRLDKDTSGLTVVGKTRTAVDALSRAIAARTVQREYVALCHGRWPSSLQQIDTPIGRDTRSRLRMAIVASGKPARTDMQCLAVRDKFSALRCKLHTGRTHQIRVHMSAQGHPLLGDALYGGQEVLGMTRQALHAQRLAFDHPVTGQALSWSCPLPADMKPAWDWVLSEV